MTYKKYFLPLTFFLIGVVSRLPFLEKVPSHWDAADWSIAVVRYSLQENTPTPPGYPLYIVFGKVFYIFIKDPHLAIVMVSVLFSGIGAVVTYLTVKSMFNNVVGIIAALLFLSGSTFYYFGITANPYGILPTTALLLVFVVYEISVKKKDRGVLLGIVYSFALGVRPQDAFFLTPLFLYGVFLSNFRNRMYTLLSFAIVTSLWFIPLVQSVHGIIGYIQQLEKASETGLPGVSFTHVYQVWFILVKGFFLSFGLSLVFLLFYIQMIPVFLKKQRLQMILSNKYITLFSLWIIPSLLFNMFVRSDHAAHQITYLTGFLVLISYAIWKTVKGGKQLVVILVIVLVLFNLYTFFRDRDPGMKKSYISQSYHYSEIQKIDIRLPSKVRYIQQNFDPRTTYILSTEDMWRPYSYYLKPYSLTALTALDSTDVPYSYYRFDTSNWNLRFLQTSNFTLTLPKNITTVILLDDDSSRWIKHNHYIVHHLAANSSITYINTRLLRKIHYGYHSITISS